MPTIARLWVCVANQLAYSVQQWISESLTAPVDEY